MGLFLIAAILFGFGNVTLHKAEEICIANNGNEIITKECVLEALEPIESANHVNYNE